MIKGIAFGALTLTIILSVFTAVSLSEQGRTGAASIFAVGAIACVLVGYYWRDDKP